MNDVLVSLRVGSQVLIDRDPSPTARFERGDRGTVTAISRDRAVVLVLVERTGREVVLRRGDVVALRPEATR